RRPLELHPVIRHFEQVVPLRQPAKIRLHLGVRNLPLPNPHLHRGAHHLNRHRLPTNIVLHLEHRHIIRPRRRHSDSRILPEHHRSPHRLAIHHTANIHRHPLPLPRGDPRLLTRSPNPTRKPRPPTRRHRRRVIPTLQRLRRMPRSRIRLLHQPPIRHIII